MSGKLKRPRDPVQLAKLIGDIATGQTAAPDSFAGKDKEAAQAGRLGGLKGGVKRAKKLTAEQRSAIAKKAAKARWHVLGEQQAARQNTQQSRSITCFTNGAYTTCN